MTLDLKTIEFFLDGVYPVKHGAQTINMYVIAYDPASEQGITIGVPQGREDIAEFIVRCLIAGQNVLKRLPPGTEFAPHVVVPKIDPNDL